MRLPIRWPWGGVEPPGLGDVAALVHRLAVMLAAGVAPVHAWRHATPGLLDAAGDRIGSAIARAGPGAIPDAIAELAGEAGAGADTGRGIGAGIGARARTGAVHATRPGTAVASAWIGLAATWSVSAAAGAPLAPSLRAYAELLRGFAVAERDTRVALAGPRATSRLVLALPLVAIAFGALLGQDTIGVLIATPLGWACLAIGSGLGLAGWAWTRRLLRGASDVARMPGLVEELTAVAMSGGVSVARARELVDRALARHGLDADRSRADAALDLAAASGAPAGELLRAEAEERRRAAVAEARERAERLSVSLMLPLGACVLPAFVAVGVVPLMAAVVGSTLEIV
ncbi:MAG TPA: hypothetical protein VNQ52_09485 [Microbacteriaceae bacterium]|nr:hypothetical protein [Microbacteriaceae bacterium]